MKALACPSCHAPVTPNSRDKFLTCEYCSMSFPNEFYEEGEEAGSPEELDRLCVDILLELGADMLKGAPNTQFGNPIRGGQLYTDACANFEIPEEDEVYFICAAGRRGACDRGFAMTASGIYFYDEEGDCAYYTWEQFTDGDTSYDGNELTILDSTFRTREATEQVGDFLIAFSNRAYSEWYDEELPGNEDINDLCVRRLIAKCEDEGHLASVVFGDPVPDSKQITKARECLNIPAEEDIYFFYDLTIFSSGKTGLAMTDSGLYYNTGMLGDTGHISWEDFVTSPMWYDLPDRDEKSSQGTLHFGNAFTLSFSIESSRDAINFYLELHNDLYEEHTGERAPRDWGIGTREKSLLEILLD